MLSNSRSLALASFFDQVFVPLHLRHASATSLRLHREALGWFERALARPPRTSDLNAETVESFLRALADVGLSTARIHELRKRLVSIWRYAAQVGAAPAYVCPPIVEGKAVNRCWSSTTPAAGTLLHFSRTVFRPVLSENSPTDRGRYDSAVNYYHDFAGKLVGIAEVTPQTVSAFRDWLGRCKPSRQTALNYVRALRRIVRAAAPDRFTIMGGPSPKRPIAGELSASREHVSRALPEPVGEPGTLVEFFTTIYAPQTLTDCVKQHRASIIWTLRRLRECFGRDLLLSELSRATIAHFVAFLKASGLSPHTIKERRSIVLSLWRFANDQELAPPVPTFRRMKVPREQPDAWSRDEVARIIAASSRLDSPPIAGIPAQKFVRAMLLVGWYTGLRRGSLLKLRPQDIELETRWLYVPAAAMKNFVGKRFRIGADAADAIREIWDPSRALLFPTPNSFGSKHPFALVFPRLLKLAGVPRSRLRNGHWHKLRRSVATHIAVAQGLAAASALLGHSTAELLKQYVDPSYMVGTDATEWLPSVTGSPSRSNKPLAAGEGPDHAP